MIFTKARIIRFAPAIVILYLFGCPLSYYLTVVENHHSLSQLKYQIRIMGSEQYRRIGH